MPDFEKYEIFEGNDISYDFTCTDAAGVAVDLSAATVTLNCKKHPDDAELTWSVECTISGAGNNVATAALTPTETGIAPGVYYADLVAVWTAPAKVKTLKRIKLAILTAIQPPAAP